MSIFFLALFVFGFLAGHAVCSVRRAETIVNIKHVARIAIERLRGHENVQDLIKSLEDIT
jgi:hypothetical protein